MKNFLIVAACLIFCCQMTTNAQNTQGKTDDMGRLELTAYVPDQIEGITESARNNLQNKLNQIVTQNGLGGGENSRFIITANIAILTKDITPTAPPMQAYTLEVTLYIGDGFTGTLFASTSVTVKGVGETETKAYLAALKNIKTKSPEYQKFIEKGKEKIIAYYNDNCDFIMKNAQTMASGGNYDDALWVLTSIPNVCKECYMKGQDNAQAVYQQKIDRDCKATLSKAQGVWAANQNSAAGNAAAQEIGELLATIPAEASCFKDVQAFYAQVAKRIKEVDEREWKYVLKAQQQESERIAAARDVGVAYGKNQPKTVYNIRGWW